MEVILVAVSCHHLQIRTTNQQAKSCFGHQASITLVLTSFSHVREFYCFRPSSITRGVQLSSGPSGASFLGRVRICLFGIRVRLLFANMIPRSRGPLQKRASAKSRGGIGGDLGLWTGGLSAPHRPRRQRPASGATSFVVRSSARIFDLCQSYLSADTSGRP
jgi:hypothetical protein